MKEDRIRYALWIDTEEDHYRTWFADSLEEVERYGRGMVKLNGSTMDFDDLYTVIERWNGYDSWESVSGTHQKLTA